MTISAHASGNDVWAGSKRRRINATSVSRISRSPTGGITTRGSFFCHFLLHHDCVKWSVIRIPQPRRMGKNRQTAVNSVNRSLSTLTTITAAFNQFSCTLPLFCFFSIVSNRARRG
ncbi:hypothetical protein LIA77_11540 [Sarocladium implicatum]|nr:hypothetical protein LIA77_11540 [Sarocladium implicatum]